MAAAFAILAALLAVVLWRVAHAYLTFRGTRIVACPDSGSPAVVEVAVGRVAVTAAFRKPVLRLRDCSRLPGVAFCDQACLKRIAAAPRESLPVVILASWYRDKACSCCGAPLKPITRWSRKPCLMSPDLQLLEWRAIQPQDLLQVLATHTPVCWTCLVSETHIS